MIEYHKKRKPITLLLGDIIITNKGLVKFVRVTPKGYNFLILADNVTLFQKGHLYMDKETENKFWMQFPKPIQDNKIDKQNYQFVINSILKSKNLDWLVKLDNDKLLIKQNANRFNFTISNIILVVDQINKEFEKNITIEIWE